MGPFVMKYWSVDEVMLSLDISDVVIGVTASVLPKAAEATRRRMMVGRDRILMKVMF